MNIHIHHIPIVRKFNPNVQALAHFDLYFPTKHDFTFAMTFLLNVMWLNTWVCFIASLLHLHLRHALGLCWWSSYKLCMSGYTIHLMNASFRPYLLLPRHCVDVFNQQPTKGADASDSASVHTQAALMNSYKLYCTAAPAFPETSTMSVITWLIPNNKKHNTE